MTGPEHRPVRGLIRRHPIQAVVLALVLIQAWSRAHVFGSSFFGEDDFVYQSRAHVLGLSHDLLLVRYGGHFTPGGFFLAWVDQAVAPLNWNLAVSQTLLLEAAAAWAFWHLLRTVFGLRWGLLAPFALYVMTPLTVPAYNWWAASLEAIPLNICLPMALASLVVRLRTGRRTAAFATVAWTGLGLLFFVKAVLIPLALIGATWVLAPEDLRAAGRRAVLARCRLTALLMTFLLMAWGLAYSTSAEVVGGSGAEVPRSLIQLVSLYEKGLGQVLVPGLLGGPWQWIGTSAPTAIVDVPFLASWTSWVLLGGFVLVTCLLRKRAVGIWLFVFGYALADLTLLAVSRLNSFYSILGLESRYVADVVPLLYLAGTFAVLPVVGEASAWVRQVHLPAALTRARLAGAVTLAVLVLSGSAAYSVHAFERDRLSREPARVYLAGVRASLASAPRDLQLYDRPVPTSLLNNLFQVQAYTSHVLAPILPERLHPFGRALDKPFVFDDQGHLHPIQVDGVGAQPGPTPRCGYLIQQQQVALQLEKHVFAFPWAVRIGYLASTDTTLEITFGKTRSSFPVQKGLHDSYFPVVGGGDSLTAQVKGTGAVCIDAVSIGNPEPAPDKP